MALFKEEPIQDLGETNEALKFRLGRLIVEAASKHDPGLKSLIDEAIEVLGSNPLRTPLGCFVQMVRQRPIRQPDRMPESVLSVTSGCPLLQIED